MTGEAQRRFLLEHVFNSEDDIADYIMLFIPGQKGKDIDMRTATNLGILYLVQHFSTTIHNWPIGPMSAEKAAFFGFDPPYPSENTASRYMNRAIRYGKVNVVKWINNISPCRQNHANLTGLFNQLEVLRWMQEECHLKMDTRGLDWCEGQGHVDMLVLHYGNFFV